MRGQTRRIPPLPRWSAAARGKITQNIDGLHQDARNRRVLELHQLCTRNYCIQCGDTSLDAVLHSEGVPRCKCGRMIRPDVVLYRTSGRRDKSRRRCSIAEADMLIAAARRCAYFQGDELVLVRSRPRPRWSSVIFRATNRADAGGTAWPVVRHAPMRGDRRWSTAPRPGRGHAGPPRQYRRRAGPIRWAPPPAVLLVPFPCSA